MDKYNETEATTVEWAVPETLYYIIQTKLYCRLSFQARYAI